MWKTYFGERFHEQPLILNMASRIDEILSRYPFARFSPSYVELFQLAIMYRYFGYEKNEKMTATYMLHVHQLGFSIEEWSHCISSIRELSPFHLHLVHNNFGNLRTFEMIVDRIMEITKIDRDTAVDWLNDSCVFDCFMRDEQYFHHEGVDFWAKQAIL